VIFAADLARSSSARQGTSLPKILEPATNINDVLAQGNIEIALYWDVASPAKLWVKVKVKVKGSTFCAGTGDLSKRLPISNLRRRRYEDGGREPRRRPKKKRVKKPVL